MASDFSNVLPMADGSSGDCSDMSKEKSESDHSNVIEPGTLPYDFG